MPTTKTIKKQLTKEDVIRIVRGLFDTELKDKIKQDNINNYIDIKQDIREIRNLLKWIIGIMITLFFGMNFYFNNKMDSMNIKFNNKIDSINNKIDSMNIKFDNKFDKIINAIHENSINIKLIQKK